MDLEKKLTYDRLGQLEQENLQMKKIISVITNECLKLTSDFNQLESSHTILEHRYDELHKERAKLLKERDTLNEEIDCLRKQWNISSFLGKRKDEVIESLNSQISELKRGEGEH